MIKKAVMIAFAIFASAPALGANPSYSGHMVVGARAEPSNTEMALYAVDFSGGSDPLGDFDLKLDTVIQLSRSVNYLSMGANINPKVTGRFKNILQRYRLTGEGSAHGDVWINKTTCPQDCHRTIFDASFEVWAYRTSNDGGVTWSRIKSMRAPK